MPQSIAQDSPTPINNSETISGNVTFNTVDSVESTNLDTQVTHSSVRNIKILSVVAGSGDRLILTLATTLKTAVDYTLELQFKGNISNSLTGFYKSSYTNSNNEIKWVCMNIYLMF